jgi:hypothetical protein
MMISMENGEEGRILGCFQTEKILPVCAHSDDHDWSLINRAHGSTYSESH